MKFIKHLSRVFLILVFSVGISYSARLKWGDIGYRDCHIISVAQNPVDSKFYGLGYANNAKDNTNESFIFISGDSLKTWIPQNQISSIYGSVELIEYDSVGSLYIIGGSGRHFLKSVDKGQNFNPILSFAATSKIVTYVIDNDNIIYLSALDSLNNPAIYYSRDLGHSWDSVRTPKLIDKILTDSNGTAYLLSRIDRLYEGYGESEYLKNSNNKLYKLQLGNKLITLLKDSYLDQKSTFVINDIALIGGFIAIFETKEIYYRNWKTRANDSHQENPIIRIMSKTDTTNRILNLNLAGKFSFDLYYKPYFLADIGDEELLIFWNYDIVLFDLKTDSLRQLYHNPGFGINGLNQVDYYPEYKFYIILNRKADAFYTDNKYSQTKKTSYTPLYMLLFSAVYSTNENNLIVADTSNKIYSTEDMGLSWEDITGNIPQNYKVKSFAHTVKVNLIAGTEKNGVLYREDDGHWASRNNGLGNLRINNLATSPDKEVFALTDGGVYSSNNECLNYHKITSYIGKEILFFKDGFFLVTTNGELYKFIKTDEINYANERKLKNYYINSLAINKKAVILAATKKNGILKSTNNGISWNPANNYLYSKEVMQIFATQNDEFIACARIGLYYAGPDADIWERNDYKYWRVNYSLGENFNEYSFKKTPNGIFYIFYNGGQWILSDLDSSSINKTSGWEDQNKYLLETASFISPDNYNKRWVYPIKDSGFVYTLYSDILTRLNYYTGIIEWEKLVPIVGNGGFVNPFDKSGQCITGFIEDKFCIYDIMYDSIIVKVDPQYDKNVIIKWSGSRFLDSSGQWVTIFSGVDTTKDIGEACSVGEIQFRDRKGNLINKIDISGIIGFTFSPDFSYIYLFRENLSKKISDNGQVYYTAINHILNCVDLNNNRTVRLLDSSFQGLYYAEFSPDNKTLVVISDWAEVTVYDLTHILTQDYITGKSYSDLKTFFTFYDNNSIITVNSDKKFVLYDLKTNKVIKRSYENYNYNYFGYIDLLDTNSFLSTMSKIKKWNIDKLLNYLIVNIDADKMNCYIHDSINFTASEYPQITSYNWDFGDGTTGTGQTCKHSYAIAGSYSIKLKCITSYGDTLKTEKNKFINVSDSLKIYKGNFEIISISDDIPVAVRCTTNISGNFTKWYWDFGDGNVWVNNIDLTYKYYKPGEYRIRLIIKDSVTDHVYNLDPIIKVNEQVSPELDYRYTINDSNDLTKVVTLKPGPDDSYYLGAWEQSKNIKSLYRIDHNNNVLWKHSFYDSLVYESCFELIPSSDGGVSGVMPIPHNQYLYSYNITRIRPDSTVLWESSKSVENVFQSVKAASKYGHDKLLLIQGDFPKAILIDEFGAEVWDRKISSNIIDRARVLQLGNKDYFVFFQNKQSHREYNGILLSPDASVMDTVTISPGLQFNVNAMAEARNSIIVNAGKGEFYTPTGLLLTYEINSKTLVNILNDREASQFNCLTMLNDSMFAVSGIYADGFIGYTVYDINLNKIERVILTTLNGGINSMYLDSKRRLHLAGYTLSSAKEFHPYVFVSKPVTYVSASDEKAGAQENDLRVYPNPAEDEFNVEYEISHGGYHKLSLINSLGMESCVLSEGNVLPGKYRAEFSITEKKLTSGIYFLRLLNDKEIITEKVIILK